MLFFLQKVIIFNKGSRGICAQTIIFGFLFLIKSIIFFPYKMSIDLLRIKLSTPGILIRVKYLKYHDLAKKMTFFFIKIYFEILIEYIFGVGWFLWSQWYNFQQYYYFIFIPIYLVFLKNLALKIKSFSISFEYWRNYLSKDTAK